MTGPALDLNDRAAVVAWIAGIYDLANQANAIGFDAAAKPEHRNIPHTIARERLADTIGKMEGLFVQAEALITEARARAKWNARQAKLPPEKRRTWEQGCADDEKDLGRALRRAGKRGGP